MPSCVMRERTPLTRDILERLPRLKLIASTGSRNASIDVDAAAARGIEVMHTNYDSSPTVELTWALILAKRFETCPPKLLPFGPGGWQRTVGDGIRGKVLSVLGLGNIGSQVAQIAGAFGMDVIAWSENLAPEKAAAAGARLVSKKELFERADILTIHLVLSARTRGLVGSPELALMKRATARLVNTSRGPIVDENALVETLREGRLAGAAVDVYDIEPLPPEHPFRRLDNVIATPHIGYVSRDLYRVFYQDAVANIAGWLGKRAFMSDPLRFDVCVSAQTPVVTDDLGRRVWLNGGGRRYRRRLISGERDAVLVDTFITLEQNRTLVEWIAEKEKNLTTIYATHGHGDHFFGVHNCPNAIPEGTVRGNAGRDRYHATAGLVSCSGVILEVCAVSGANRLDARDRGRTRGVHQNSGRG